MNKRKIKIYGFLTCILTLTLIYCGQDAPLNPGLDNVNPGYKTENVVIVVIDGARWSETWGDVTHQYVPQLARLASQGVIGVNFTNKGVANTLPAQTAICTGVYQNIDNMGQESPLYPSLFQYYLKHSGKPASAAFIIASKDKLGMVANCKDPVWKDQYVPSMDCGNDGSGNDYRHDSITWRKAKETLAKHHPNLVMIQFKEPDISGHMANWQNYLQGITDSDNYLGNIWDFLQQDSIYAGKTTLIMTNDHGRHLDYIGDGFVSHGDKCSGCTHLNFLAIGPDFKQNTLVYHSGELIDIPVTVSKLLGFELPVAQGRVLEELFIR